MANSNKPPSITVAICTRNRADFLRDAVASVLGQISDDTEIVIIDNASTDDTAKVAAEFAASHACVFALREDELGLSAARNQALRSARGRFVIFLDDDATAEPGWLEAYRNCFQHPPVPQLAGAGGAVFPRYDEPPPVWIAPGTNQLNFSPQPGCFGKRAGPWGCNFAIHREQALAHGGFNTALGRKGKGMSAHEETELFWKFRQSGGAFWWLPGARIKHHVAAHRLTFGAQCRDAFAAGRSAALYRLDLVPRGLGRALFRVCRAVLSPFQSFFGLLGAVIVFPFQPRYKSASFVFRAMRNAGFGLQAVRGTGPRPSGAR